MLTLKKFLINTPGFEYLNRIRLTGSLQNTPLSSEKKAGVILDYAKKYGCTIFVETGTFRGDTLAACKNSFEVLYSIELGHNLFLESKKRFASYNHIHILEGNSGDMIRQIKTDNKPTLYWLDAHYSEGETAKGEEDSPIMQELNYILNDNTNACILIDDARCFNGKNGYPTKKGLGKLIQERNKADSVKYHVTFKNDIIRIAKEINR